MLHDCNEATFGGFNNDEPNKGKGKETASANGKEKASWKGKEKASRNENEGGCERKRKQPSLVDVNGIESDDDTL